jgi:hypothetical protein
MAASHVQTNTAENNSGTPETTLTIASATYTSGNTLVVSGKWEGNVTITSIADSTNGSYTLKTEEVHSSGVAPRCQQAHIGNITGFTGTITVTFSGTGATWSHFAVSEYSGMPAAADNSDQFITAEGSFSTPSTNPPASGNVTTTQNDEVCVAIIGAYTGETFSSLQINGVAATARGTFSDTVVYDTIPSATFTGQATGSMDANSIWVMSLLTLKASTGGGGTLWAQSLM